MSLISCPSVNNLFTHVLVEFDQLSIEMEENEPCLQTVRVSRRKLVHIKLILSHGFELISRKNVIRRMSLITLGV